MKKYLSLFAAVVLAFVVISCTKDPIPTPIPDPTPEYSATTLKECLDILQKQKIVSDVKVYANDKTTTADGKPAFKEVYQLNFIQPLDHYGRNGYIIPQRMIISYTGDPNAPTIFYTGGYALDELEDATSSQNACPMQNLLNANYVNVEYRYFAKSVPNGMYPDLSWTFFDSDQMARDQHLIYLWLKPFFKGKWVSTGTSKGGITSAMYAHFFPKDMDLYVPFAAPFFRSMTEECQGDWLRDSIATPEIRKKMNDCITWALHDRNVTKYAKYINKYLADCKNVTDENCVFAYNSKVIGMFMEYLAYHWNGQNLKNWLDNIPNDSTTPEQFYFYLAGFDYKKYIGPKIEEEETKSLNKTERMRISNVTKGSDQVVISDDPYDIQAHKELGYYMYSRKWIGKYGTNEITEEHLKFDDFSSAEKDYITFNPSLMRNFYSNLKTTTAKIIFVYGSFDHWTGGGVKGVDIAGNPNIQRFLITGAGHSEEFYDYPVAAESTALQNAIKDALK